MDIATAVRKRVMVGGIAVLEVRTVQKIAPILDISHFFLIIFYFAFDGGRKQVPWWRAVPHTSPSISLQGSGPQVLLRLGFLAVPTPS